MTIKNIFTGIAGLGLTVAPVAAGIFVGKAVKDYTDNTAAGVAAGIGTAMVTGGTINAVAGAVAVSQAQDTFNKVVEQMCADEQNG